MEDESIRIAGWQYASHPGWVNFYLPPGLEQAGTEADDIQNFGRALTEMVRYAEKPAATTLELDSLIKDCLTPSQRPTMHGVVNRLAHLATVESSAESSSGQIAPLSSMDLDKEAEGGKTP